MRVIWLWCMIVASCLVAPPAHAATKTRNVLVVYSNNRLVPSNIEVDLGLRTALMELFP